jgi:hypothetical protein
VVITADKTSYDLVPGLNKFTPNFEIITKKEVVGKMNDEL